jgi:hypothetical protein
MDTDKTSSSIELALLTQELRQLKYEVKENVKRTVLLEGENEKLQRKLLMGKGILIGVLVATGSAGVFIVDYLRGMIGLIK